MTRLSKSGERSIHLRKRNQHVRLGHDTIAGMWVEGHLCAQNDTRRARNEAPVNTLRLKFGYMIDVAATRCIL